MKATFKNIGPIKDAELELGDLTIIAGENNTGKTYLAYTLYGFLKSLGELRYDLQRKLKGNDTLSEKVEEIARQIKKTKKANVNFSPKEYNDLKNFVDKHLSSVFSSRLLHEIFSSPKDEFKDAKFHPNSYHENSTVSSGDLVGLHTEEGHFFDVEYTFKDAKLMIEIDNPSDIDVPTSNFGWVVYWLFENEALKDYPVPFILSAERFGISLFYKELDFTKNRLVEGLQRMSDKKESDSLFLLEKQSARYAQPIKDNIDFTRALSGIQKNKSEIKTDKLHSVEAMMDGSYKAANDEVRFISKRKGEGDNRFDIPLHLASSSARGVSDLYFYLKHEARKGQLLIIDEPESHLSPANQILMARLLVFCVNSGLKVLITTHSDYLIKEINNLIMLSSDFEGKSEFLNENKKDYSDADYLNQNSLSAYVCENGGLKKCNVDKEGIDMPNFDAAIDKINKISNTLGWLIRSGDLEDD